MKVIFTGLGEHKSWRYPGFWTNFPLAATHGIGEIFSPGATLWCRSDIFPLAPKQEVIFSPGIELWCSSDIFPETTMIFPPPPPPHKK